MHKRILRIFSWFLIISLLFGGRILSAPTTIAESAPLKPGDANGDGKLDASDAPLILRHLTGLVTLSPEQLAAANVDGMGGVTVADAALVLRHLAGLTVIPDWAESLPLYNPRDIAVINTMIDNNGLDLPKADPVDGTYVPEEWQQNVAWSWDTVNKRVTTLHLWSTGLTGVLNISGLSALEELSCNDNQLTELNLSGLPALEWLYCNRNRLTELNLSGLPSLRELDCAYNQLTELELSGLLALEAVFCNANRLSALHISGLPFLRHLYCCDNQISELELFDLPSLFRIYCEDNNLSELTLSGFPMLRELACAYNQLAELCLFDLPALQDLGCAENLLTELDVSALAALEFLSCDFNNLSALSLCPDAPYWCMDVRYNHFTDKAQITGFDPAKWDTGECHYYPQRGDAVAGTYNPGDIAVINAIIDNNGWSMPKADPVDGSYVPRKWGFNIDWSEDVSNKRVVVLNIWNNNLSGVLNVAGLAELRRLSCDENRLTGLDVSNNPALEYLNCEDNRLTELVLTQTPALETLECSNNALTEIDLRMNLALKRLQCTANPLVELDVSNNLALKALLCCDTELVAIDLRSNFALEALSVSSNSFMTALDVSNNSALKSLSCGHNTFTELNLSHNLALEWLWCNYSQLTTLALCPTASYQSLDVRNNRFTDKSQITGFDSLLWDTGNYYYSPQTE
ncbi:MAG: leucine-rich repeat domain-containing protein [Clostridiales bacterium]|nr:leucine-rich repeat domain-containing protein [Clostridiales bacterium]